MIKKINLICLLFAFAVPAFGLVDYTEPAAGVKTSSFKGMKKKKKSIAAPRVKTHSSTEGFLNLTPTFGFETKDLDVAKSNFYNFGAHLQTRYGVFFDTKYWTAASDSVSTIEKSKFQPGNLTTVLGFNWLSLGDASNRMTLDLAFGAVWGSSNSEFGASRLDKIVMVSSSKRFYHLGLGFEYQLRLAGDPKKSEEVAIGNIHKISAVIGWVATNDISFELEGALYRISAGDQGQNHLEAPVSFSYLSPKLNLQLSRVVELQLGGLFRVERVKVTDELLRARLWDLPGVYSNSIFANLNLFM